MGKKSRLVLLGFALMGLVGMLWLAGCTPKVQGAPGKDEGRIVEGRNVEVTLYFSDDQAMEVLPEKRTVEVTEDEPEMPIERIAVLELLKGPSDEKLRKTLPPEAQLLSIAVRDGVATVDFSQEFQTKHWGGSAGEGLTINSLVKTLTGIEGIDRVQVLIEGEVIDSLAGHYDWSEPFAPESK